MLNRLMPLSAILLAACAPQVAAPAAALVGEAAPAPVVRGATFSPQGYATILDAPPAPFIPAPPAQPQPMTADQLAGHEQFARAGKFQNEVMSHVSALDTKLRRAEKGNYVNLYYDNEGDPSVVFQFLRNGPETLRKYTKHPRFFGKTVRYSRAELMAAMDFMMKTFLPERVIESAGIGRNEVTARITVPESEFRDLIARKGITIPESVVLEYTAREPAASINRPLAPNIASLVRIFPRSDRPVGIVNSINSRAKVVLRDGCFRASDQGDALVLFPLGANLFIDREGYLAFGSAESPGYARVGETVIFAGSIGEVTAPEIVGPIHAACGTGKVIGITGMRSAAADRAETTVHQNAQALRQFREWYGLSENGANAALQRCIANAGGGFCPMSPPSPPISTQASCPAGTKLSYGMCRTPEGYIRPIPKWLEDLANI